MSPSTTTSLTVTGATGETYGEEYVEGDPMFVYPAGADFHLRQDSPAIDQGSPADAPAMDFEGHARPYGAGLDIGADEYTVFTYSVYLPVTVRDHARL